MKTRSWLARAVRLAMVMVLVSAAAAIAPGGTAGAFGQLEYGVTLGPDDGGDPDGSGSAVFTVYPGLEWVCFTIQTSGIGDVGAAHIHEGAAGATGGVVVNLAVDVNGLSGCVMADDALLTTIGESPGDYYLNVHTAEYPAGAIRGQLGTSSKGGQEPVGFVLPLMPSGDADGEGAAFVQYDPLTGFFCSAIDVANIADPTAAHVHAGAEGENGPVVIDLMIELSDGELPVCQPADVAVLAAITANPAGYYVNVHNEEHPGGAIRGQLDGTLPEGPDGPPPTEPAPTDPPPAPPVPDDAAAAAAAAAAAEAAAAAQAAVAAAAAANASALPPVAGATGLIIDLEPVNGMPAPNASASFRAAQTAQAGELAFTGPATMWLANTGLALLAAGFLAMGFAHRRRTDG